jgi:hypothetical protein
VHFYAQPVLQLHMEHALVIYCAALDALCCQVRRTDGGPVQKPQDALRRATRHVLTRVTKCTDVDGGIIKNVL